jgi:hypothetical protein
MLLPVFRGAKVRLLRLRIQLKEAVRGGLIYSFRQKLDSCFSGLPQCLLFFHLGWGFLNINAFYTLKL